MVKPSGVAMSKLTVGVVMGGLLMAACSTRERTTESGMSAQLVSASVTAERVQGGVRITNGTSSAIAYVVWDAGFLGLLGPCDRTGDVCPLLAAGKTATVGEGVPGFSGTGDAIVYWWSVESDPLSQPNQVVVAGGR